MRHSGDIAKIQSFDGGFQSPDVYGYGEDFGEFTPTFTPARPHPGELHPTKNGASRPEELNLNLGNS
ncbi:unnamed protein product [Dovyalis caffra]|uniref:Uncharacterized protein n=1 Tax=Dovyalis caffra TaxID=77055 RepID=A0AAV1SPZ9_9ROSI|nr:unnamed protein product [Dovyalis caffra]